MKQVIVLDTPSDGGFTTLVTVFWHPVTSGKLARPGATSLWRGASVTENAAIANGDIIEEQQALRVPASFTAAQSKAFLEAAYAARAAFLSGQAPKGQYYGVFFDPGAGGWSA